MIKAEINDKELSEYLSELPKDDMIHFIMGHGRFRGAIFHGTHFVNQMRAQHKGGILESYILGQACLSGALLIPAVMKGREHISLQYNVDDSPAKGFCVEADSTGWVRGYLYNDHIPIEKPLDSWDLKPFLGGDGFMTLQTMRPNDKQPQVSSVNTTGNIADDIVFYFDRSEQIKTAFTTSIQMDRQARIIGAGGIFVQVMPETGGHYDGEQKKGAQVNTSSDEQEDEALIEKLEERYKKAPSIGTWFSQGRDAQTYLEQVFGDFEPVVVLHRDIVYDCPCCHDTFLRHIRTLPASDIADIKQKGEPLEIVCRSCASVYNINPDEI